MPILNILFYINDDMKQQTRFYQLYYINHLIFQLFLQKMNESRIRSPDQAIKKSQLMPSPNNSKSKAYLPSRYAQQRKPDKTGFNDILNSIQTKTNNDMIKSKCQASPKIKKNIPKMEVTNCQKKPKTSQFKSRPLKRQKSDEMNFNQIFLNPRQEALEQLKKKSQLEDNIKTISKQYQKLLKFGDESKLSTEFQSLKQDNQQKNNQNFEQMFQMLESGDVFGINIETSQNDFYDNHISIQPPDVPSTSNNQASSGTNYAPSIPSNYKSFKNLNIKQLLMRARAGMNGEDVIKQAHLSYFLGQVYSDKKMFSEALKFHRRYLGFAKAIEDMIGMGLGANRVAISYYNCGQIQKSIIFHNQNLKLSNNDNCFVGFYNIGICYRKLKKLDQALQYFESALSWAQQKGEQQSQCIALGQIGVTYQSMELYAQAISKFERSIQICEKIKKQNLKLHNLRYILRICSMLHLKPMQQLEKIVQEAFICAQQVQGCTMLDIFRCNIGIVKGIQQMSRQITAEQCMNEVQYI